MEFVTVESYFGVPENSIRANTRNRCSEDFVGIIDEVARILYPNDKLEIYLLPAENGPYKDTIKIIDTATVNAVLVGVFAFTCLTYKDSRRAYLWDEEMNAVDEASKYLALQKQLIEVNKKYGEENILKKIEEICENVKIKELKNDRFKTLYNDDMIASDKTILKNSNSKNIAKKKIDRVEFESYVEDLPQNEEYVEDRFEGFIELISLVVRQKREGKGITWRGAYYGEDIKKNKVNFLSNGEEINFYMQDNDFKKRIDTQKITFSKGDSIKVIFSMKGLLKNGIFKNRNIYITEVIRFNEEIIEHKLKFVREQKVEKEKKNKGQVSLFELGL